MDFKVLVSNPFHARNETKKADESVDTDLRNVAFMFLGFMAIIGGVILFVISQSHIIPGQ